MVDASSASARPLVDITPETLLFELHPNAQPGCPLYISNSSEVTIAFKVKTTEPRRYLVRPNQGMVGPGETGPVNVYLIAKECAVLLKTPSALDKVSDKFLVQSVALGDMESALISSAAANKQAEALSKVWTTFSKSAISNKKLNVQVSLSRAAAQSHLTANTGTERGVSPARMAGANPAAFASPPHLASAPPAAPAGPGAPRGYGSDNGRRGDVGRGGVSGLEDDSRILAHKYEDLVNYTANLTEERDDLNQSLEEAKKALQREMATRIALESKGQLFSQGRKGSGRGDGGVRPPPSHQRGGSGFGWGTLAFVAVLFFFLGHWLDFASAGTGAGGGSGGGGAQSVGGVSSGGIAKPSPPVVIRDTNEAEGGRFSSAAAAAGLSTHEDAGNPPPRDG